MEMNETPAEQAVTTVIHDGQDDDAPVPNYTREQLDYVLSLVEGTTGNRDLIDRVLPNYLKGWKLDRLSRVDRQILRLAVYELLFVEEVPPRVVVNEAIELAKHFGTEESGKFVNGVLGKLIQDLDRLRAELKPDLTSRRGDANERENH
jgi:N utilization substance protein B